MRKISIIVAVAENGAIGKDQQLLWRLPNDLKLFKRLTLGNPIIMGRNTFLSLPNGALPKRKNIVVTSSPDFAYPDISVARSVEEALCLCGDVDEVFFIGGAMIYKEALHFADTLYLTRVHHTFSDADTFFPEIDLSAWEIASSEEHSADETHKYPYTFITYCRK